MAGLLNVVEVDVNLVRVDVDRLGNLASTFIVMIVMNLQLLLWVNPA